jgi:hypothetical protein
MRETDTDLMTRLAAPETLWERHDSYCELEETYDHELRAETEAGDLVIVIPPDHEDSDGDRDYDITGGWNESSTANW